MIPAHMSPNPMGLGQTDVTDADRLRAILRGDPLATEALARTRDLDLPDAWIVSGLVYNTAWNQLTGRPSGWGVKDVDLFYFDASDLSYEAEDRVIRHAAPLIGDLPAPVEIRNQARAHLWVGEKFGIDYPPLPCALAALERFAALTHAVAVRLTRANQIEIAAPFGLDDILNLRLRPNRRLANRPTYEAKAARAAKMWPEVTIEPW